ncbi:MAG: trehalose-phosphatase [Thermomicrobiales bacterium]
MRQPSLDQAVAMCTAALSASPAGLFADFDGTLSPVASKPDEAYLAPGGGEALSALLNSLDTVMIVTGRSARDASKRIGVPGLSVVGNHGLELMMDDQLTINPAAIDQIAAINASTAAIERAASDFPFFDALVIENKQLSASVHYRLAPDVDAAYSAIRPIVASLADEHNLVLTEGKLVIELRPRLAVNKGTAVKQVIDQRGLRGAVMLGDDVTDVDAFLTVRRAREEGMSGVAVAVLSPETHQSVLDTADVFLHGVDDTVRLLQALAGSATAIC